MITVATVSTEFGEITILRSRDSGSHLYREGNYCHSEADRSGVSLASYVHAIYALLAQSQAREVLMIGCGGGTLGTMLAREGRSVTIVDVNPASIALARRYFSLPPDVACHVEDGRVFLERAARPYDAIIVDAFVGGTIPTHFCSAAFFRLAARRLAAPGCLFVNVLVGHDLDTRADVLAACMVKAGFQARLLDTPGEIDRNAIVMGGAVGGLLPPGLLVAPEALDDRSQLIEELERMRFRAPRPLQGTIIET